VKNKHEPDAQSIVAEINHLHNEVGEGLKLTVTKAIRIGELLSIQKAKCAHGEWIRWVEANLAFNRHLAARYMACYQNREKLNVSLATHLTIEDLAHHSESKSEIEPKPEKPETASQAETERPAKKEAARGLASDTDQPLVPKPTEAEKPEPGEDATADKPPESDFDEDSAEKSLDGIRLFAANLLGLYRESNSTREKLDSLAEDLLEISCWFYETLEDIDPQERRP
jgi:hypothetical protein